MPLTKADQKKLFTLLGKQFSDAGPEQQWTREDGTVLEKTKKRPRKSAYDDYDKWRHYRA